MGTVVSCKYVSMAIKDPFEAMDCPYLDKKNRKHRFAPEAISLDMGR